MKITKKEAAAIENLKEAIEALPPSIWLFAAAGKLCIMKNGADGKRVTVADLMGYDQDYVIETIPCSIDGGDW